MPSRLWNPIREDEVLQIFSDPVVAKLSAGVRLPGGTDILRLAAGIRASAEQYARDVRKPSPNALYREVDTLQRAADKQRFEEVARLLANLSKPARELLEDRASIIRSGASNRNQRATWFLPRPEELRDVGLRLAACERVYSVAVVGGSRAIGRKRPNGKRSNEWRPRLLVRGPTRAEPRREAERTFLMWLRANYVDATGVMPPRTAHHDTPGPFARMVGDCLRLARAPTNDPDNDRVGLAVQLINDFDREQRLEELVEKWRRILDPLRHKHVAISQVARLIEEGKAAIRRLPSGAEEGAIPDYPALTEYQETGTLCFYLSSVEWRTVSIKPFPRERIMQIAEALFAATSKRTKTVRRRLHKKAQSVPSK